MCTKLADRIEQLLVARNDLGWLPLRPQRARPGHVPALLVAICGYLLVPGNCPDASAQLSPKILNDVNLAIRDFQEERFSEALERFSTAVEAAESYQPTAEDYAREAQRELQNRKVETALAHAKKAIELDDALAPAYYIRGEAYSHMGQVQRALDSFERALQLDPGLSAAAIKFWEICESTQEYGLAINTFRKYVKDDQDLDSVSGDVPSGAGDATRNDPPEASDADRLDQVQLLFLLGQAHLRVEEPQAAVEVLTRAVRLAPDQFAIHRYLVLALTEQTGDPSAPIRVYESLVEERPEPFVKLSLAKLYIEHDMLEEATELLQELASVSAGSVDVGLRLAIAERFSEAEMYAEAAREGERARPLLKRGSSRRIQLDFDLGKWLVKAGDVQRGLKYLHNSLKEHIRTLVTPPLADYFHLGNAYRLLGDRQKAEIYFRQFLLGLEQRGQLADVETLELLGDIYVEDQNHSRAAECFEKAIEFVPEMHGVRLKHAGALYDSGEFEACIAQAKRVEAVGDSEVAKPARLLLARAYHANRQTNAALGILTKLENTEEWGPEADDLMAHVLRDSGQPQKALPYAKSCYEASSSDSNAAVLYAQVLALIGQHESARPILDPLLRKDPSNFGALVGLGDVEMGAAKELSASDKLAALAEAIAYYQRAANLPGIDPTLILNRLATARQEVVATESAMESSRWIVIAILVTFVSLILPTAMAIWFYRYWQQNKHLRLFGRVRKLENGMREKIREAAERKWQGTWQKEFENYLMQKNEYNRRLSVKALKAKANGGYWLNASNFGHLVAIIDVGWKEFGFNQLCTPDDRPTRSLVVSNLNFLADARALLAHFVDEDQYDDSATKISMTRRQAAHTRQCLNNLKDTFQLEK